MKNKLRMFQYLIISAILYVAAAHVVQPQMQIILWKSGHITVGAFLGYWIDRAAFPTNRIAPSTVPLEQIRRALIVAAAVLASAMGL